MKRCVLLVVAVLALYAPAVGAQGNAHKGHHSGAHEHRARGHGGEATVEVDAASGPRLRLELTAAGTARHELRLLTENFRFVPEQDGERRVVGEGHAHLYIDGVKLGRLYAPVHLLPELARGVRDIEVELVTSDHAVYVVAGQQVAARIVVRVNPQAGGHAARQVKDFTASIKGGAVGQKTLRVTRGDTVRIHWHTDATARLHLHGYDIEAEVAPGMPMTMQFDADIAGRFPVASHGDGKRGGHAHRSLLYVEVHPK